MDSLLSLQVFRQIVDSGRFASAAARLNLSKAMTTKHGNLLTAYARPFPEVVVDLAFDCRSSCYGQRSSAESSRRN
jgi:hypothetical protein